MSGRILDDGQASQHQCEVGVIGYDTGTPFHRHAPVPVHATRLAPGAKWVCNECNAIWELTNHGKGWRRTGSHLREY